MNLGQIAKVISKLNRASASSVGADTRARHRHTGAGPDNVPVSCHSAPEWPDTWITKRKCARPPSAALDICVPLWGLALPLSGAGAECSGAAPGRACPWGCHNLYPTTNAGYVSRLAWVAPRSWSPGSVAAIDRHSHSPQPPRRRVVRRLHPSPGSFSSHFSRDRWGWDQQRPPKPGLAQHAVRRLPFPLHTFELITLAHQARPQLLEQSDFTPMLKAAMDRTVVAIDAWDMVPLTAGAQMKNDPIQDPPPIHPLPARPRRWIKPPQQWFNPFPQFIRNFPQRGRCAFALGHRSLPFRNRRPLSPRLSFEMDS